MYIHTSIVFQRIAGFGPSAWIRDERTVSIHRLKRYRTERRREVPANGDRPVRAASEEVPV